MRSVARILLAAAAATCFASTSDLPGACQNKRRLDDLNREGFSLATRGQLEEAKSLFEQARDEAAKFGKDSYRYAVSLLHLGQIEKRLHNDKAAETFLKQALAIMSAKSWHSNPDMIEVLGGLIDIYRQRGRPQEAIPLYKRKIEILGTMTGADSRDVLVELERFEGLAGELMAKGLYKETEDVCTWVLPLQDNALGKSSLTHALTLDCLAGACLNQEVIMGIKGRLPAAERYYRESLEIKQKRLGTNDLQIANSWHLLGNLYTTWHKYQQAEQAYGQALLIDDTLCPADDAGKLRILRVYATMRMIAGNDQGADLLFRRLIRVVKKTGYVANEGLSGVFVNYPILLNRLGKPAEAKAITALGGRICRGRP